MNIFATSQEVEVQQERDSVGRQAVPTNLYPVAVKNAYVDYYPAGSAYISVELDVIVEGQKEPSKVFMREIIWSATTKGDFYIDKKTGAKRQLMGKAKMDSLSKVLTGKGLQELFATGEVVNKMQKLRKDGKEVLEERVTMVPWIEAGQFHAGIQRVIKNKQIKQGDKYVNTPEKITENEVVKFFDDQLRTNAEIADNAPATHHVQWTEAYAGKDRNLFKEVSAPATGIPTASTAVQLNI